ncbi:MAG: nucleoside hydrolase [Ruminococcaceae bacterium]|nr:nucleoside hydrolase [Oscillospiraceae bacterium]
MKIIFDTDFGDDIDDSFALAYMLKTAPKDIALITSSFGQTRKRAALIARFLTRCGYKDIPIGIGAEDISMRDPYQYEFGKDYSISDYGCVIEDGVKAAVDIIMTSDEPVTVIALGPMTNLAKMLEIEPEVANKVRVVAMFGSIYGGYFGGALPDKEYNVFADIEASKKVIRSYKDITVAPLDVCSLLEAAGEDYAALINSEDTVAKVLISDFSLWLTFGFVNVTDKTSILYDILPIYMVYDNSLLEYETLPILVDEEGYTKISEEGNSVNCAVRWISDKEKFIRDYCTLIAK